MVFKKAAASSMASWSMSLCSCAMIKWGWLALLASSPCRWTHFLKEAQLVELTVQALNTCVGGLGGALGVGPWGVGALPV